VNRHGKGSDAEQQGKEEAEGGREQEEGRSGTSPFAAGQPQSKPGQNPYGKKG
jgi:hypothetical protein